MFTGAITALVTPFRDDYSVDFDALDRLIDFQLEAGIEGLVPCGSTGEAITLTPDERNAVIQRTVERVNIITDRDTGQPRGFAFVEMSGNADAAISALNGREMDGRALNVNEARPKGERSQSFGGNGRGRRTSRW